MKIVLFVSGLLHLAAATYLVLGSSAGTHGTFAAALWIAGIVALGSASIMHAVDRAAAEITRLDTNVWAGNAAIWKELREPESENPPPKHIPKGR